jgi:hypothetical protein
VDSGSLHAKNKPKTFPSIVDLIHLLTSLHILFSDPLVSISLFSTKQRLSTRAESFVPQNSQRSPCSPVDYGFHPSFFLSFRGIQCVNCIISSVLKMTISICVLPEWIHLGVMWRVTPSMNGTQEIQNTATCTPTGRLEHHSNLTTPTWKPNLNTVPTFTKSTTNTKSTFNPTSATAPPPTSYQRQHQFPSSTPPSTLAPTRPSSSSPASPQLNLPHLEHFCPPTGFVMHSTWSI